MEHWKALFPGYGNNLTKPYPHMRETLAELSARGARMGVLSNKFDAGVQQVMNQFMPGTFAVMHGECDGIPAQARSCPACCAPSRSWAPPPPARPTWATPPATSRSRRMPARSPIGVSWGYHHADELRAAQANVVIDSPEELLRFASERS